MKTKSAARNGSTTSYLLVVFIFLLATAVAFTKPRSPLNRSLNRPAGTSACVAPPSGLVSWWPGEGNAHDIVSHNNGALNNGAGFDVGEVGQGFSLDGSDDEVRIGNPASLKLNSISIDAWVKPTNTPGDYQAILTKWNQNTGTGSGGDSYGLWLFNSGSTFQLFSAIHQTNGAEPFRIAGNVPLNQFSHVAMTYDSATGAFAIYVTGSVVSPTTVTALGLVQSDVDVHIGRENDNIVPRFFPGVIDEVEVFDRALSQPEIQAIYDAGSAGKCHSCTPPPSNLVGWWPGDRSEEHTSELQSRFGISYA